MDFEFSQRSAVKGVKQTMEMTAQLVIEAREKLCDLLLRHRWRQINIPNGQAGKVFHVAREQAMQERGAAAEVSDDKQRFVNRLCFVPWKKQIIQKETKPVEEAPKGPNGIIE